jgi:hypothetical protein
MIKPRDLRNQGHWQFEDYHQRITTKQWKELLLNDQDKLIFKGRLRQLKAKNLGAGVIEISKEPLNGN